MNIFLYGLYSPYSLHKFTLFYKKLYEGIYFIIID